MKVLLVTTEIVPFAKVGGLADVAGSLPKALRQQDVDIRVILPLYQNISKEANKLELLETPGEQSLRIGWSDFQVRYYQALLPDTDVPVVFVDCPALFDRPGIYNDPRSGEGYWDNPTRFLLFNRAVLSFMQHGDFKPDVVHLNDNQTAPLAPMLRQHGAPESLASVKILLALHNVGYHGQYDLSYVAEAGLDTWKTGPGQELEFFGGFNFLKSGIEYADRLVTVSPTYAQETMESFDCSRGLEGVLRERRDVYTGILNGVDYDLWDPRQDGMIPYNYSEDHLEGKRNNKEALLRRMGLPTQHIDRPLIGFVGRLFEQKGMDLIEQAVDGIVEAGADLVILGSGRPHYHWVVDEAHRRHPNHVGVYLGFNEELAHWIEAGADMFLMPSLYEPCGMNQLFSLRYGTIPLVRKTGGLKDTVEPYNHQNGEGTGFLFEDYNSWSMLAIIKEAIGVYHQPDAWRNLIRNAMSRDFSWSASARKYKDLYGRMLS